MQCRKCAYERVATDSAPSYECPRCGIVYAKYKKSTQGLTPQNQAAVGASPSNNLSASQNSLHKVAKLFAYILAATVTLTAAGYFIDPRIPIVAIIVIVGVWIVRKAIEGSREQARKKAAAFENMPYQHCMTCGHDFKHDQSALRGSTTMEVALWILILWPIALVYSIWRRIGAGKAKVACLVCASTQVVPASSPAAIAHKRALGIQDGS